MYHQDIHKNLIDQCKAGKSKAQYELYQCYAKAMYNICYRMMNNREEAEDMLQESFTDAFLHLETFRFDSSFGAWLKRITINKCINALAKRHPDITSVEILPDLISNSNNTDEEEDEFTRFTVTRIQKAMEKLPDGYRVIFSLYLLEGYDHLEIAQILGINEATSKSQYSRAKQKIRELIKFEGDERQA